MKLLLIGLSSFLFLAALAGGEETAATYAVERPFSEGGSVRLHLSSGDYTIRAGRPDRILVRWEPAKHADSFLMKKVKVRVETGGSPANIETDGPTGDARIVIELPARSDLDLRMFAGEVEIRQIEGDKDVQVTFGKLKVDANPASYFRVSAGVKVGELNAERFHVSKDGFGRDFQWQGAGKYRLQAQVFAGDLTLN